MTSRTAPGLLVLVAVTISCSGFSVTDSLGLECTEYTDEYASKMADSGLLLDDISADTQAYPMAVVLSQHAVNALFREISEIEIPEIRQSTDVLLGQELGVSIRPQLPLLQIGGDGSCAQCIQAHVPFDVGLELAGFELPRGAGSFSVQVPVGLQPEGNRETALIAAFQSIEVIDLELNLPGEANRFFEFVEPLINYGLSELLQSRFSDARIATIDSFSLGAGEVLLAARGPFVNHDHGTITLALQSNLPLGPGIATEAQAQLPDGAEIGIVIHPGLLGAMGRRMLFEDVIPKAYDANGNPRQDGGMLFTLDGVSGSDDGLLRARSTLFQTDGLCGSVDLAASIGLSADASGISLSVRDVQVSNGRGSGQLLQAADSLAGNYLDSLLQTLSLTINYGEITGGEAGSETSFDIFSFNVDSRGITLYRDLLPI